jgi:hypothetical protein
MNASTIGRLLSQSYYFAKGSYKVTKNSDGDITVTAVDKDTLNRIYELLAGRGYMLIETDSGITVC